MDKPIKLKFSDFFELMALKITYQRKLTSQHTIYEASKSL